MGMVGDASVVLFFGGGRVLLISGQVDPSSGNRITNSQLILLSSFLNP